MAAGSYTVSAAFAGDDTYQVNACEGPLEILPPSGNNPPTAVDDSAETDLNVGIVINVLTNDTDIDGDTLTITNVTAPANGSVVDNGDGTVTYTPNANFTGTDEFEYTISDGNATDTAKVTIQVKDLTAPPVDYGLQLFENATEVTDGTVNLNQEIRAVAETNDTSVSQVTFRWIRPSGEIAQNVTVPIASPEDTFTPDEQGTWTVEADFGNGQVIQKTLDISFFVVPESPIGAIATVVASMGALAGFLYFKSRKPMNGI